MHESPGNVSVVGMELRGRKRNSFVLHLPIFLAHPDGRHLFKLCHGLVDSGNDHRFQSADLLPGLADKTVNGGQQVSLGPGLEDLQIVLVPLQVLIGLVSGLLELHKLFLLDVLWKGQEHHAPLGWLLLNLGTNDVAYHLSHKPNSVTGNKYRGC